MQRITNKNLEYLVNRINEVTNSPKDSWIKVNDKLVAQVGNYHLDHAYGGVTFHRTQNEGGGVEDVLHCGYVSKRELYNLLNAFIRGLFN